MKRTMKVVLGLLLVLLLAGGLLFLAIRMNGPAALNRIDRLTGGNRDVTLVSKTQYGRHDDQKLRIYTPAKADRNQPLPIIVFAHGGSWNWGNPDDYTFIARALAPKGFVVALVGYRLGEDGRYPVMLEDTAAAIIEAVRIAPQFGGDPNRVILTGHSAGAYNVVQVALEKSWLAGTEIAPRGVIGLAGPYDFYPFDKEASQNAFGSVEAGPESQPVNHAHANGPPMLLVHGKRDTLVKPRNTRALAQALTDAGASVETRFYDSFDHNAPLISLASPWRDSRNVDEAIIEFSRRVSEVSVPVQAESP